MDIDTPVFTSYKFDGVFVKMLMENPHLRSMKKGHIHSHNKMTVFFSGVDTPELLDNSEFHNYYLSLIVNNVNEMIAKVAYRVHKVSTTTDELTYNDVDGKPIVIKETNEIKEDSILVYDCDIVKPFIPDAFTRNRFCVIKDRKKTANDLKHKQLQSESKRAEEDGGSNKSKVRQIGWNKEKYESKGERSLNLRPVDQNSPDMKQAFEKLMKKFDTPAAKPFAKIRGGATVPGELFDTTIPEVLPLGSAIDGEIRTWMIDLLGNGVRNQQLSQVLGNLAKRVKNGFDINAQLNLLMKAIERTYYNAYPDDPTLEQFNYRLRVAINMLNNYYSEKYPNLINRIVIQLKDKTYGGN